MNTIDAKLLARMFLAGAKNLEVKKEWINELNVFPVPDGDTGTNMTLTIMSAVKEVNNLEDVQMTSLAKAISWVTTSIVMPLSARYFMTSNTIRVRRKGTKEVSTVANNIP